MRKFLLFYCALVAGLGLLFVLNTSRTSAVTAADWQSGRIIDDAIFFNKDAMTAQQIQAFLNSKVPTCDYLGSQPSGTWYAAAGRYYTRAERGAIVGNPAPFTCLKDYRENPSTNQNNYGNVSAVIPGAISAAQIIWNAAQQYNINPQVLLVTLQKEQGLITDDWPFRSQYIHAMGANCPDTPAGCDPAYSGFATQVKRAGYLFNYYKNNINQFNFNVGTNYVLWNVASTGCGGGNVNIQNIATAMLYIYTPYQPNSASLNAFPGQGDGCSSYGNRNFWYYFNNWFGTTLAPTFAAKWVGQTPHTSAYQGQKINVFFEYKNVGTGTWLSDEAASSNWYVTPPIHLATSKNINRISSFSSADWLHPSRPSKLQYVKNSDGSLASNQNLVFSNQIAGFSATFIVPIDQSPGLYSEYFQPILEGSPVWQIGGLAWIGINVLPSSKAASFVTQSPYPSLPINQQSNFYVVYKNSGDTIWGLDNFSKSCKLSLATTNQINRSSVFGADWGAGKNRPKVVSRQVYMDSNLLTLSNDQTSVKKGQFLKIEAQYSTNSIPAGTTKDEWFQLICEGALSWNINGSYFWLRFKVI